MTLKPFTDEQKRQLEVQYGVDPIAWPVMDALIAGDLDPDRDVPFLKAGFMEFAKLLDQMGILDEVRAKFEADR